ncbi:MAG: hypothetical protein U0414_44030 [Polyangiaceae bacterium]
MTADPKKSAPGSVSPSSSSPSAPHPFERTVTLDPAQASQPPRRSTAVLTPEEQAAGAARAAQANPVSSSGIHPRAGTLVIENAVPPPAPGGPSVAPSAPTFGAPPPAAPRKSPLEGMSFTGTAVVDASDEVRRARERLRIGDARATQLGVARLSAAHEAPTSTRAPFRITPPSPESDRESRPTLPPWMETPTTNPVQVRHPLERTQEASPSADVFEKIVPGLAPTPHGQEVWQPPPKPDPGGTLPSPIAAPPPPPAIKEDAYRPAGTPIVAEPASPPPLGASPYRADPSPEELGTAAALAPTKAEAPKAPERKSVTGGLYSKFGKK